jgi:hypothetical protein
MGLNFGGRPTLSDIRTYGDYASLFRWRLVISEIPRRLAALAPGNISLNDMNILCESTSLPTKSVDKMMIAIRGHKHFQPGIVTPSSQITLNFVETAQGHIHNWLLSWQEAIWEAGTGRSGLNQDIAIDNLQLVRLGTEDDDICTYQMVNVFLENYTYPNLDGATSGPFTVSAVFSFDDFFVTLPDGSPTQNPEFLYGRF